MNTFAKFYLLAFVLPVACSTDAIPVDPAKSGKGSKNSAISDGSNGEAESQVASASGSGMNKQKVSEGNLPDPAAQNLERPKMQAPVDPAVAKPAAGNPAAPALPKAGLNIPVNNGKVVVSPIVRPMSLVKGGKAEATFLVSVPDQEAQGLFGTFVLKGETCTLFCGFPGTAGTPFEQKINVESLSVFPKGTTTVFFSFDVPNAIFKQATLNICFKAFSDNDRKNAVSDDICWDANVK
ncbi:MAG: hypothetical protein EBR09_10295 [Proteobacteria bacterium]|nr:hypothetical protein [Pseudomonadota bacterium]